MTTNLWVYIIISHQMEDVHTNLYLPSLTSHHFKATATIWASVADQKSAVVGCTSYAGISSPQPGQTLIFWILL